MIGRFHMVLVAALFLASEGTFAADRLELVKHVNLWTGSPVRSPDTSGLTYHSPSGRLIIADSEVSEYGDATDANGKRIFSGHNVFEVSLDLRKRFEAHLASPGSGSATEPTGIAYNPKDGHIYVADDDRKKVFRYPFDGGRKFGPPSAETKTGLDGRYTDPEGIACDPETGTLYVMSGTQAERVLKFRFDTDAGKFVSLGDFSVAAHIRDPEGIGVDPATGNLFLVSTGGIAEFEKDGTFVQFFDYTFFDRTDVASTLPGGLTFAPSSDPNDHPDNYSIYISHRGIDNGAFPGKNTLDGAVSELRLVRQRTLPEAIRVPADHPTIQAAIDAAADGDTVLVSPGVYREALVLADKALMLASEHFLTGRREAIDQTIIDGNGKSYAVKVAETVGRGTTISGFTIRNAEDGIKAYGLFNLTHCHVTQTGDGIDYERGGGLVSYCRFTLNRDDGIDLDGPTAVTIEHCRIEDNRDDGIEIRLHPYTGEALRIRLRNNRIERNGEDGIQLIGDNAASARTFLIEGNFVVGNAKAGIGCMGEGNTKEDYSGAPIPDTILVFNNTFVGNSYHITGGKNLLAVNNIFARAGVLAVKNCTGRSRLVQNLFWSNPKQQQDSNIEMNGTVLGDPRLETDQRLQERSPAIDAGVARVTWQGKGVQVVAPSEYRGDAPDLGAFERQPHESGTGK